MHLTPSLGRVVVVLGVALGCSSPMSPRTDFIIEVDSLRLPEHLGALDTLVIRAYGTIGPSLCFTLDRVESTLMEPILDRNGRVELTFVGRDYNGPGIGCPGAIAELDWESAVLPPFQGEAFEIVVRQPSGELLEESVPILAGNP